MTDTTETFRVAIKDSIFEQTGLEKDDFESHELTFASKEDATAWVTETNELITAPGTVTLHTAHPNDSTGVDAYLIFKPTRVWVVDS